nr:uncharacterized protein LOC107373174 isoform X2 [Nothobranchius furzeri]
MDLATDAVQIDEDQANNLLNSVLELDENRSNPMDSDYVPPICIQAAGGLQRAVDALPIVGQDESVIDILQRDGETDEEADNPEQYEEADNDVPSFPSVEKVSIEEDLVNQPACITFTSSMARLVNFLQLPIQKCFYRDKLIRTECDATPPFHFKLNRRGSATIIEWFCINGHMLWKWNSQPVLKFMNIGVVSPKTFRIIQNYYLVDSIKDFWEKKRAAIIDCLRVKESVVALADGRMDSPGHTAQFCTYTTMENDSKDIISVVTVDKRQTNRNSVTDAHMQISALLDPRKGRYKEKAIIHSLDVWHAAKNLTKKLHVAGILKGNAILLVWLKDIVNQFWYICQKAQHRDMFNCQLSCFCW